MLSKIFNIAFCIVLAAVAYVNLRLAGAELSLPLIAGVGTLWFSGLAAGMMIAEEW